MESKRDLSRRTVIRGAAWSVPVVAAAVAVPMAAASTPQPNSTANYYWDPSADADFTTLDAATSGLRAQFSTQISYQADPWVSPPEGATLVVTVFSSGPVTVNNVGNGWTHQVSGDGQTVTFMATPASFGGGLTADIVGTVPGPLTSTATMSLPDGGSATWAQEPAQATAILVA